ncbi:DUF2946 family protein [uncultured Shimia sp.]|uniref:DUF2946 family protein n=1 Tax=uncultured Shimia sp. TaxID=573152 RepID=UPI0026149577|nr:DUF2946 family protein [uncultured Shimia sp.]
MSSDSPTCARLSRSLTGLLAVVALVVQMMVPQMAHANASGDQSGDWIEICADAGPVMVRLREDGSVEKRAPQSPSHGGCPKCLTCVTCAGVSGIDAGVVALGAADGVAMSVVVCKADSAVFVSKAWERPMTRGPPCGPQYKNEMARAGHVMTANPTEGGAL